VGVLIGDRKEMILLVERHNKLNRRTGWFEIICFGRKRHYRKDGSCKHTESIIRDGISPKYQKRVKVIPFGNKGPGA
jgi:hypothetical protein